MIELRPHQCSAMHALWAMLRDHRRVLMGAPTGFGKRYCGVWVCEKAVEQGRKVLVVTNRRLLVEQFYDHAEKETLPHGVIMADSGDRQDLAAPIQVASLQTLEARYLSKGEPLPPADLVLVDEAHRDIDRYLKLFAHYPDAKVLGLTATPVGPSGRSLCPPYDIMFEGAKNSMLIAEGLLLPTRVFAPSEPNLQGVRIVNREDYSPAGVARRVREVTCFADLWREWQRWQLRKTVVFAPGVEFARGLTEQFTERLGAGTAYLITAETPPKERTEALLAVEHGRGQVLVSVDILREGWDCPVISCGIDCQPTIQTRSYWQKLGRIKRAHEGQQYAVWIDMAGNYWKHPHPDDDPDWTVTGDESTRDRFARKPVLERPHRCSQCGMVKSRGGICLGCGHEPAGPPVRRIRMGDGRLKEIPLREKPKKTGLARMAEQWKSILIGAMKANMSFGQARGWFRRKHGEWLDPRLPFGGHDSKERVNYGRSLGDVLDQFHVYGRETDGDD